MSRVMPRSPWTALFALLLVVAALEPAAAGISNSVPSNARQFHKGILMLNSVVTFPDAPPPPATVEQKLDYCELVLAELEAQLPRKSLFRWLFLDRTRLASGYEKEFRFSYDFYPYLHNRKQI